MAGRSFESQVEHGLDATQDQVWAAITSGPGTESWFMGRLDVEPREGGTVRTDMGGFTVESTVTAWDPPRRFGYRMPPTPTGSFLALEWLVEGRGEGSSVLRCVGSGFAAGDDWEAEYDALRRGGDFYTHNLVQYLTHFTGRHGRLVSALLPRHGDPYRVLPVMRAALGIDRTASVGDEVRLTPTGFEPVVGVVDYSTPEFLGVRTADALYRFFPGMGGVPRVEHHVFADVDRQQAGQAWQTWLTGLFA